MTQPQNYPPTSHLVSETVTNPKKSHGCLYAALAVFGALVLLVIILAIVGAATSSKTSTSTGPSTTAAAGQSPPSSSGSAEPGTSQSSPAPVGTAVSPAKDWTVVVNSAVLNANAQAAAANQFNKPQPGGQFVIVNLTVKNGSARPNTVGSQIKWSLITTSGVASPPSFSCSTGMPQRFNDAGQLQPGASSSGNVCFEVPAAEASSAVLLAEPLFTTDTVKDQRFLALT